MVILTETRRVMGITPYKSGNRKGFKRIDNKDYEWFMEYLIRDILHFLRPKDCENRVYHDFGNVYTFETKIPVYGGDFSPIDKLKTNNIRRLLYDYLISDDERKEKISYFSRDMLLEGFSIYLKERGLLDDRFISFKKLFSKCVTEKGFEEIGFIPTTDLEGTSMHRLKVSFIYDYDKLEGIWRGKQA